MSDYLPQEVILEILYKLPVKSVIRCRCVCKSWYLLITSNHFITNHLKSTLSRKSHQSYQLVLLRTCVEDNVHYLLHFDNQDFDNYKDLDLPFPSFIDYFRVVGTCNGLICLVDDLYSCEETHWDHIYRLFSCNGTLCLRDDMYPYTYTYILWNPMINKSLTLPKPNITYTNHGLFSIFVGFGYDSSTNDYKVLRILDMHNELHTNKPLVEAEIYSLNKGCWKSITANTPSHRFMDRRSQALANGVVHWIAIWEGRSYEYSVLGFCMATEAFNEIMLPQSLANARGKWMYILAYRELSIAVAYEEYDGPPKCHVWVMKEYGVSESWVKLCGIELDRGAAFMPHVLGFRQSGLVLCEMFEGWISSFDPEGEEIKHHWIRGDHGYNFVDPYLGYVFVDAYMETLVLLDKTDYASFVADATDTKENILPVAIDTTEIGADQDAEATDHLTGQSGDGSDEIRAIDCTVDADAMVIQKEQERADAPRKLHCLHFIRCCLNFFFMV